MSSKHHQLQLVDVQSCRLPWQVEEVLAALCQARSNRKEIRVLDLGCGRGAHVFILRQRGYSAYGLDVDQGVISKGEVLFDDHQFNHAEIIKLVQPGSPWPFEDGFFDLVFSDQVLEHVADLDGVLAEASRVTKSGGIGFHRCPARYIWIEPHVFVPFVHWLPKAGFLRSFWLFVFYKSLPMWHGQRGMSGSWRIRQFVNYLDRKTFYRSFGEQLRAFTNAGFRVAVEQNSSLGTGGLLRTFKHRIKGFYYSTFVSVEIRFVRR